MKDRYIVEYVQVEAQFNQFVFSTANNQSIKKGPQLTKGVQTSGCFSPAELLPEPELVCGDTANKKEGILPKIVSFIKIGDPIQTIHLLEYKMQSLFQKMCKYTCVNIQKIQFQKHSVFYDKIYLSRNILHFFQSLSYSLSY